MKPFKDLTKVAEAEWGAKAMETLRINELVQQPDPILFSNIYDTPDSRIPVLIVDESHHASNPKSTLSAAIRSLKFGHSLLLTATPKFESWETLSGQAMLLAKSGLFTNSDQYRKLFQPRGSDGVEGHPTDTREQLFQTTVEQMVVSRPRSVLELPPIHYHKVGVGFQGQWSRVIGVNRCVAGAVDLLKDEQRASSGDRDRAVTLLAYARQFLMNPILSENIISDADPDELFSGLPVMRLGASYNKYLKNNDLPLNLHIDKLDDHQFALFMKFREKDPLPVSAATSSVSGSESSVSRTRAEPKKSLDLAVLERAELLVFEREVKIFPNGFEYYQDGMLELWDSGLKEAIRTPRILEIIKKIKEIRRDFPSETIMVVSISSELLEMVDAVLVRMRSSHPLLEFATLNYDNFMDSYHKRAWYVGVRYLQERNVGVVFVNAYSGHLGVNVPGASHVLFTDPIWNPKIKMRMEGCVHQMGQTRTVHVWEMVGDFVDADKLVTEHPERKAKLAEKQGPEPFYMRCDD